MLRLILFECVCLLVSIAIGKPILTHNRGISPPDSDLNLVGVFSLVVIAVIAALGVAVSVVVRAGAGVSGESSDDEFEDITLSASLQQVDTISREGASLGKNGKNTRGKDISWILLEEFSDAPEFNSSDLAKKITREFTASRKRQFQYAEVTDYTGSFRKNGIFNSLIRDTYISS